MKQSNRDIIEVSGRFSDVADIRVAEAGAGNIIKHRSVGIMPGVNVRDVQAGDVTFRLIDTWKKPLDILRTGDKSAFQMDEASWVLPEKMKGKVVVLNPMAKNVKVTESLLAAELV